MTSLTNILFIPPCGYFNSTGRLICTDGKLVDFYLIYRQAPYFTSNVKDIRSFDPSIVSPVDTSYFLL